jgi:ankyrin repeat protein
MLSTDPNERDRAIISHIDFYGWNDWDFLPWKPEELRRLVCAGANINAKDSNGRTLLHRVCTRIRKPHCLDMVKQILELGAELTPDCDGLTPIMLSVTPAANGIFTSLAKMVTAS